MHCLLLGAAIKISCDTIVDAVWMILWLLYACVSLCVCLSVYAATGVEVQIEVEVLFVCGELWPAICAHNLLLLRRIKMKKENN